MNRDINLNLYKVFYYVATYKSFKMASSQLCVSQPAVSKQIKNLEELLDVKLFYRFNKGIELTKEGKILLTQIEKMNFHLEASIKYISSTKKLLTGDLVIGCPSHITSFYLLEHIEKFRKDHENINIKVISDSTISLIEDLNHHRLDFIIDSCPIEVNSNDLVIKELDVFDTILIAKNDYECNINSVNDLNGKNLILPLSRSSMRKNFEKALDKYDIKYEVGVSVDTTDLIISAVKRRLGIGYVIKESVINELRNGNIKQIDIDCELPKLVLNLVYARDYLSYPAKEFLKKYLRVL